MSKPHVSLVGCSFVAISFFYTGSLMSAYAACYGSPTAAVDSMKPGSSIASVTTGSGYQVTKIVADPILGQRWAIIASCDHPERPAFSLKTEELHAAEQHPLRESQTVDPIQTSPVVHVGDVVRLWRQEALLRIELSGVAEENGSLGKLIRVRLFRRNTDDPSAQSEFLAIVRGKSDVELQP